MADENYQTRLTGLLALAIVREIKTTRQDILFYPYELEYLRAIKVAHVYFCNRQTFIRTAKIGKYLAVNSLKSMT